MNRFNIMWIMVFIYVGISGLVAFLLNKLFSILLSLSIFVALDTIWIRPYVYRKFRDEQKSEGGK